MITTAVSSTWLRRFHEAADATARLVCFAHAGGSASFFHPVSARFSPATDVVSVQYPGRQDRRHEPLVPDLDELADRIAAELAGLDDRPTAYFGHSMGAVLAFEVARRLEAGSAPTAPGALVLSGRRAPSAPRDERYHELDDDGLLATVAELNGPDMSRLDDDFLRLVLPVIRNDYRAVERYRHQEGAVVHAPLTVLTGRRDPRTDVEEARAWQRHTTGGFRFEVFEGDHFFLVGQAAAVGDRIAETLDSLR